MDLDVERLLAAVERTVSSLERDGQAARAVTLARSYATTVEDLWDGRGSRNGPRRCARSGAAYRGLLHGRHGRAGLMHTLDVLRDPERCGAMVDT